MALGLNRIWVRFGLWITAAVLLAIASLAIGVLAFSELQYREFYRHLPSPVKNELETLKSQDLEDSPRALQIYSEYWEGDRLFGEKWSLVIGLAVSLPFGMAVGFWISRRITSPLASMVEVAARVERGDLASRAVKGNAHGEMAEMKTLLGQVEHLGRLVGDLHTLSMADAGQLSLRKERIDLAALVGDVVEDLHPQLQKLDMALSLDLPMQDGDGSTDIKADVDRLRQITTNLISNVLRHASSGHWLSIRVHTTSDHQNQSWVTLEVGDAGPGLAPEVQAHPFQRFVQAPGKRRREGSGLGLSIVKALVTSQGGTVSTGVSERGGALFTVRFPRL